MKKRNNAKGRSCPSCACKKPESKVKRKEPLYVNPDIVFREEGKEALVFDPSTGSIKVLNYVGKMVWKMLNGKNSTETIVKKVAKKFNEVPLKTISGDVDKFLEELEQLGYLAKQA